MAYLTSIIELLHAANWILAKEDSNWTLISENGARVQASANVCFELDVSLDECAKLVHLLVLSDPL